MSKPFKLTPVKNGLKEPTSNAIEVKMSQKPTPATDKILWTFGMSGCDAIATYNAKTKVRTLTHLPGGNPDETWFEKMVKYIDQDTVIILVAGGSATGKQHFEVDQKNYYVNVITNGIKAAGGTPTDMYKTYFRNDVMQPRHNMNGFVFRPDGRYGLLRQDATGADDEEP
ncbi:uncharacterized protein HMPREF1541_06484 [Cyphellophora europaea CBS 101466]|uniref:Uncharacterized protein n=1 Tax=Cyphellophora europaea (strain CBS 101466) TaxID=1220924 RepID=W2RRW9_CYPE1|nr:uncharacterized protein HMPREF1541_06484 [Cyphellophora europaea CBS 101466]ETN38449.1 hypothetical protein HMPREF1541_06484 [Cyphellophora europaea CBS 101466]